MPGTNNAPPDVPSPYGWKSATPAGGQPADLDVHPLEAPDEQLQLELATRGRREEVVADGEVGDLLEEVVPALEDGIRLELAVDALLVGVDPRSCHASRTAARLLAPANRLAQIDVNCSCSRAAIGSPPSFSKVMPAAWKPAVGTVSPKTIAKKSYGAPWKYLMPSSSNWPAIAGL